MPFSILLELISYSIIGLYFFCQSHLLVVSIAQFTLLVNSLTKSRHKRKETIPLTDFPMVTIQLPVYNEKYVVTGLINSVLQFDYPPERMEIQILDDSNDETSAIIRDTILSLQQHSAVAIHHIQRVERTGYKAGALKEGLALAKGEFVAIFDADYRPPAHFLKATLPLFKDSGVGMVQSRCGYNNRDQTLITRTLAFGMDIYYTIEQSGRYNSDVFFIFNGTGGIWRKKCIEEVGNWQGDTLAEDMDLSYRAQMNGWHFEYMEDLMTLGELPPMMSAVRVQQYRWIKGSVECAYKLIPTMLRFKTTFYKKFHALVHLTNSYAFLSIFLCSILSIPMMMVQHVFHYQLAPSGVFFFSSIVVLLQVYVSIQKTASSYEGSNFTREILVYLPLSLVIFMGLYIENAKAALHGILKRKTAFMRTPKMGEHNASNDYFKGGRLSLGNIFELLMLAYFSFGVFLSFYYGDVDFLVFHLCLIIGYFSIFFLSYQERRKGR